MRKILIIFCVIISTTILYAGETVYMDNENIQEYRGNIGQWLSIKSIAHLRSAVRKFKTNISEVRKINHNKLSFDNYLFVPFSNDYFNDIKEKENSRLSVVSEPSDFIWPLVKFERISSKFGNRWGQLHTGIDLPAQKGVPVVAAMDGRVVQSTFAGGHGKSIYIEHRNNFYTRYSHNSVLLVKKGDFVKKGQIIGLVGTTGNSTGNHLHFEIRYKDIPLDPLDFMPTKTEINK